MSYTHLSQDERYQIQHLHRGGFSASEIGRQIRRATTTISRELRRNASDGVAYQARPAHRQSMKRRHAASTLARIHPDRWSAVDARLAEHWSPEQITAEALISHERIYQHIAADRQRLGAYSDADIQAIEDKLNQRPRKRLGFRKPQQVFDASFNRGALRS
jgi:IS30 family transposase